MPRKDIVDGEPYTEEPQGRSGLELTFESSLRGTPGMINLLYSPDGELLHQEVLRHPTPGHNIVTTLDYAKQKYAENALRKHAPRGGAMVIVDVQNGDILAMASNPGFDLNEFIPGISDARYAKLRDNPLMPMHGRAFQGRYPPASTFKAITSIAALECGAISPSTYYHCNTYFKIGEKKFWNWNHKTPEGDLNVVSALKRSCNPFFYQAALDMGKEPLIEMSQRLGFGEVTGIPLPGENAGIIPTDAYMMRTQNMRMTSGILAQMAIGQVIEASPLQVAQGMAGIANGESLPKLRLVKQIQDFNDGIVEAWDTGTKKQLNFKTASRDAVVKGMVAVVNGSGGTGHQAYVKNARIAGKTGTAQWKYFGEDDDRNRNLAWFAGFLPADNPQYAFAVVYEGAKGESVSGGQEAAPIVKEVFANIMRHREDDPTLIAALNGKRKKDPKDGENAGDSNEDEDADEDGTKNKRPKKAAPKAKPVQQPPPQPAAPPTQSKGGLKGLFRKLFKKTL
jgi:penicillin-binding protein 2